MASYYITAVSKDGNSSIKEVYAINVADNTVYKYSKAKIIPEVEKNLVYTLAPSDKGNPKMAKVSIVCMDGTKYLRTDENQTKADNLESLPVF